MILLSTEHTVQASRNRFAGRSVHRSSRSRRVHLPWRGERTSALAELIFEDS